MISGPDDVEQRAVLDKVIVGHDGVAGQITENHGDGSCRITPNNLFPSAISLCTLDRTTWLSLRITIIFSK
jgi:hypothetical protein